MEYKNITEEQRDNMTSNLRIYFELGDKASILVYQQAQKEEIKDLQLIAGTNISVGIHRHIVEKLIKLKFESELK